MVGWLYGFHQRPSSHSTNQQFIMYKYILQSVENVNWLAVASLIIFFVIFVVSAMWAFMSKKDFIDKMSKLPLDNEES
jgi:hypothetical protein